MALHKGVGVSYRSARKKQDTLEPPKADVGFGYTLSSAAVAGTLLKLALATSNLHRGGLSLCNDRYVNLLGIHTYKYIYIYIYAYIYI